MCKAMCNARGVQWDGEMRMQCPSGTQKTALVCQKVRHDEEPSMAKNGGG
jgi:hypothetical protein